jgi:hypothetical protein
MLSFLNAILGTVLLVAGRKIFWLLVGTIGFIIGVQVATRFFHGSELINILAGLVLGIIFAGLAIFLESVAVGLAGFLGGGYIAVSLAGLFGLDSGLLTWVFFVIGGILGAILVASLLDWALILISSLAGASLIIDAFHPGPVLAGAAFLVLLVIGILIQSAAMHREEGRVEHRHA